MNKACPFCGETILEAAKKCKHCGEFLDPVLAKQRAQPVWNPGTAALLNLVLPGAGYIYMGQIATGILNLLVAPFAYFICWSCAGSLWIQGAESNRHELWPSFIAVVMLLSPVLAHLSMVFHPFRIAKAQSRFQY